LVALFATQLVNAAAFFDTAKIDQATGLNGANKRCAEQAIAAKGTNQLSRE